MHAYWRGLIHFRRSEQGQVFRIGGTTPPADYYQWIEPEHPYLLGYVVDQQILVLANTDTETLTFEDIALPEGTWRLIANGDVVNHQNGVEGPALSGGTPQDVAVPGQTALVLDPE